MIKSIPLKKLISSRRPFFLYDEERICSNIKNVTRAMEEILSVKVTLAFSLKTQPNYKFINTIKMQGLSLDVSSLNELNYALSMGFPPDKIYLGGVGLTDQGIRQALHCRIQGLHLNSISVFDLAEKEKSLLNSSTDLSIRFHPEYLLGSKLGTTKEDLLERFKGSKVLNGLHVYVGRESFAPSIINKLFSDIEDLIVGGIFSNEWTLYFGPGLPDMDQSPIEKFKIKHGVKRIKVEVGRSIASSCGYYAAPVLSVKQFSEEKKTVIIDGGLQHFGSPWINLRHGPNKMKALFCDSTGKLKTIGKGNAAIYGSLCLWHDCLHPNLSIPNNLIRGDWLMIPNMGAYGLTAGVPLFIGETLPLEFYFDGKRYLDVTHYNFGKLPEE